MSVLTDTDLVELMVLLVVAVALTWMFLGAVGFVCFWIRDLVRGEPQGNFVRRPYYDCKSWEWEVFKSYLWYGPLTFILGLVIMLHAPFARFNRWRGRSERKDPLAWRQCR